MPVKKIIIIQIFIFTIPLIAKENSYIDFAKIKACFELTDYKITNHSEIQEPPQARFVNSIEQENISAEPVAINALFIPDGDKLHIIQDIKTKPSMFGSLSTYAPIVRTFDYPKGYSQKSNCDSVSNSVVRIGKKCGLLSKCSPLLLGFGISQGSNGKTKLCKPTLGGIDPLKYAHTREHDIPQMTVKDLIENTISERLVFIAENMKKGLIQVNNQKLIQATKINGPCAQSINDSDILAKAADSVVCPINQKEGGHCPPIEPESYRVSGDANSLPATE